MNWRYNVGSDILFCISSFLYIQAYEYVSLCRRRKDDGAEPEADPERDQRTVFAFQVCIHNKNLFTLWSVKYLKFIIETNDCKHDDSYL